MKSSSTNLMSCRNLALSVAAGLLACAATAGANELVNPNLDVVAIGPQNNPTPVNWSVNAYKAVSGQHFDGCSSEPWANVLASGGQGLFFKQFAGQVGDEITVYFYQDVAGTPGGKYTLSGYAAAEANFCGFFSTNSPAPKALFVVECLDAGNNVLSSNGLDLVASGLPSSGSSSSALFTVPEVTAPANTAKIRAGAIMINGYATTGGQAFTVDAFDLAFVPPPGAPEITKQPVDTTVSPGSTATLTVQVANPAGVTYQWMYNSADLADGGNVSGATTPTLTIANASASNVGLYRVRLTANNLSVNSSEVRLALTDIDFFPVITITGLVNDTYRVDYATRLNPDTWIPLSTNKLTSTTQMVVDSTSPMDNSRFYRAVFVLP